ncbi:MAG: 3'-5' exonuclease [Planctomycetes bacterium]|nr:3'-5' exonuclease [Planctomycetota bacterium]
MDQGEQPKADAGPLVFFDLESTGTSPATDRIVSIAFVSESGEVLLNQTVNPEQPIPPGASEIHGISDADVADAPRFAEIAAQVQGLIEDVVLGGYNSRNFDAPLLDAELRRAGQPGIDLSTVQEVDVFRVWLAIEPRTLVGAVRHFLGRELEGAHDALHDARATAEVLQALAAKHGLGRAELLELSRPPWEVDRAGKFRRDEESGQVVFGFGKLRGQPVAEHQEYLQWMLTKDFPPGTKAVIRDLLGEAS